MDKESSLLKIASNEQTYGSCSKEDAANFINNEDKLGFPLPFALSSPDKAGISNNIKIEELRRLSKEDDLSGLNKTLEVPELYAMFKSTPEILEQKERNFRQLKYNDAGPLSKLATDYAVNSIGLDRAAAYYDIKKAEESGDLLAQEDSRAEYNRLTDKLNQLPVPEDGYLNTLASVTASGARNIVPLLASTAGAAAVTFATGGAAAPAAVATAAKGVFDAAVIFQDTKKVEAGEFLQQLDAEYPNMSQEEKLEYAEAESDVVALSESLGAAFGLVGLGGRAVGTVVRGASKTGRRISKIEKAGKKQLLERLKDKETREKIKDPNFLAFVGKRAFEHTSAAAVEGGQEAFQSVVQEAYLKAVEEGLDPKNAEIVDKAIETLQDGDKKSEFAKIFMNTALASLTLSGAGAVAMSGARSIANKAIQESFDKRTQHVFDKRMEMKEKDPTFSLSPKADEAQTKILQDVGSAPEKVYVGTDVLSEVLEKAETEGKTNVIGKLTELGITQETIDKANDETGEVAIDFAQFDKIVIDPEDKELFQELSGHIVVDQETLSEKEIANLSTEVALKHEELKESIADEKSVFRETVRGLKKNGRFSERQIVSMATIAQMQANTSATWEGQDGKKVSAKIVNQTTKEKKENPFTSVKRAIEKKVKQDKSKPNEDYIGKELVLSSLEKARIHSFHKNLGKYLVKPLDGREASDEGYFLLFTKEELEKEFGKQAENTAKKEKLLAEQKVYDERIRKMKEAEDAAAKEYDNSYGYADNMTPMKKAKVLKILNQEVYYRDVGGKTKLGTRKEMWKHFAENGYKLEEGHLYAKNDKGYVDKTFMTKDDDSFVVKTKTEKDFAQYMIDKYGPKDNKESAELFEYAEEQKAVPFPAVWNGKKTNLKGAELVYQSGNNAVIARGDKYYTIDKDAKVTKRESYSDAMDAIAPQEIRFQESEKQIAGSFKTVDGENIITLTQAANPTTFLHEFNHLYVTEGLKSYNSGKMTPYWKKQFEKLAEFVGAKPVNGKLTFTTEQMEKSAYAFQEYLMEGKAPVSSLESLFARMREWFIDTYRKIRMSRVRLSKSVRETFDAMIVGQDKIDDAKFTKQIWAIERLPNVSEAEYEEYRSDIAALDHRTTTREIRESAKRASLEAREENKEMKAKITVDVLSEIKSQPEQRLRSAVIASHISKASLPQGIKLDNHVLFVREDGLPIQQFVTDFSDIVSNAGDVIELLNTLETPEMLAAPIIEQRMNDFLMEKYPELQEENARISMANEKLLKVKVKEFLMLKGIPLSHYGQYMAKLKEATNNVINETPISKLIDVEKWLKLETKIVSKSLFAKNNNERATAAWHQAVVNLIIQRAYQIKKESYRFTKHFKKYRRMSEDSIARLLKEMDGYDIDMVQSLLYAYQFSSKPPRVSGMTLIEKINNWVHEKNERGFSDAEAVREYAQVLAQGIDVPFAKITYKDFAIIDNFARLVEAISKEDKSYVEAGVRKYYNEAAADIANYIGEKGINPEQWNFWIDNGVMKETFLSKILPNRIFLDFVLPFVNGFANREQRISKVDNLLAKALAPALEHKNEIIQVALPEGRTLNMTVEAMQVAVLNIDNMETWLASYNSQHPSANLTETEFEYIIQSAPQFMLDSAKMIWDLMDSQKEEFRDAQHAINGYVMRFVEPRTLVLPDGREIKSGYFPRGKVRNTAEFKEELRTFKTNDIYSEGTSGFAKDRTTVVHKDLDLTLNSVKGWMYHTATIIDIGPVYQRFAKLMNNEITRNALGEKSVRMLKDWANYSIAGDEINSMFSALDKAESAIILGGKGLKFFVQALGFVSAFSEVGPQWIVPELLKFAANPYNIVMGDIRSKDLSVYMRERFENAGQHLAAMTKDNQKLVKAGKMTQMMMDVWTSLLVKGDGFASYITWRAAFRKAIAQGKTNEQASLYADHIVRTTQGDTTGPSRPKILQGNARFITKFASYFMAVNSRVVSSIVGKDRVNAVSTLMFAAVISAALQAFIQAAWDWSADDEEKEKDLRKGVVTFEDKVFKEMIKEIASSVGGTIFPVAGIGGNIGNLIATGDIYESPLPLQRVVYDVGETAYNAGKAVLAESEGDKQRAKDKVKKTLTKPLTQIRNLIKMFKG